MVRNEAIRILSTSVINESEWSASTGAWSDKDWERFARLTMKSPSQFVGYHEHLWQKLSTLPPSSQLRETLLDACFKIAIAQNEVDAIWKRIRGLEDSDMASLHIFRSQLKKEQMSTPPWWLICESGLDRLESLEPFKQELLPDLIATLSNIDRLRSTQSVEGIKLTERLRAILKQWQQT